MNSFKRNKGIISYLSKKIARRYLRNISKEHFRTKKQLAMLSFDFISQIISIDGKVFFSEILMPDFDTKTTLNTTVWPSGSYFVKLIYQNGNTVLVKQIVVEH